MNAYQWSCKEESALSYSDELEKKFYSEDTTDCFSMKDQRSEDTYEFQIDGIYKDKQLRLNLLQVTLKKLKLFGNNENLLSTCFLSSGFELNEHECKGILESLKGSYFFSLVKIMIVQKYIQSGHNSYDCFRIVNSLKEPIQTDDKTKTKRERFTFCNHTFSIEHMRKSVYNATQNTIWFLQGFLENGEKTLYDSPWSEDFNHARYRLAKHICSFSEEPKKMLDTFLINHSKVLLSSTKRPFDKYAVLQEEKCQKKIKSTSMPLKGAYEGNEHENSSSEDTVSGSGSDNENTHSITVDNENSVRSDNTLPVVPETTIEGETEMEEEPKTYKFRGPERWEKVKDIFKTRHEPVVALTKIQKQAWLYVCITGLVFLVLTVLIDYDIVPMVGYNIYEANDVLACFGIVFIGIMLTCRKEQKWSNIVLFIFFCFLSLWTGKGRRKEFKFPALSYVCFSSAILLYRKEKKWILGVPATGFIIALALGYYFSVFDFFSRCCAMFFTATSFFVEFRKKECQWHKILVSPIRDICFLLFFPLYLLIQCSG